MSHHARHNRRRSEIQRRDQQRSALLLVLALASMALVVWAGVGA